MSKRLNEREFHEGLAALPQIRARLVDEGLKRRQQVIADQTDLNALAEQALRELDNGLAELGVEFDSSGKDTMSAAPDLSQQAIDLLIDHPESWYTGTQLMRVLGTGIPASIFLREGILAGIVERQGRYRTTRYRATVSAASAIKTNF